MMESSTTFTVLYFGPMADLTGVRTEPVDAVAVPTVGALLEHLRGRYAAVAELDPLLNTCAVAVNMDYADGRDAIIAAGDEVAIIPPVSSG
jgi:molybdopterin converting factor subunit 1